MGRGQGCQKLDASLPPGQQRHEMRKIRGHEVAGSGRCGEKTSAAIQPARVSAITVSTERPLQRLRRSLKVITAGGAERRNGNKYCSHRVWGSLTPTLTKGEAYNHQPYPTKGFKQGQRPWNGQRSSKALKVFD